jgi:hypothetical protein
VSDRVFPAPRQRVMLAVRFIMKREMNREEKITEAYLKSLGFKDVIFEPDGNIPPDFSIDGRTDEGDALK